MTNLAGFKLECLNEKVNGIQWNFCVCSDKDFCNTAKAHAVSGVWLITSLVLPFVTAWST